MFPSDNLNMISSPARHFELLCGQKLPGPRPADVPARFHQLWDQLCVQPAELLHWGTTLAELNPLTFPRGQVVVWVPPKVVVKKVRQHFSIIGKPQTETLFHERFTSEGDLVSTDTLTPRRYHERWNKREVRFLELGSKTHVVDRVNRQEFDHYHDEYLLPLKAPVLLLCHPATTSAASCYLDLLAQRTERLAFGQWVRRSRLEVRDQLHEQLLHLVRATYPHSLVDHQPTVQATTVSNAS